MRTNIPEADKILDIRFPVGDKGFVCLLDYFGTDLDVEAAARVSYADGTRQVSDSRTLIRYLIRHNHSSPLEMCSLKFHLKMPLYVIQQLLRHRTAKLNQASYRYSEVPDEYETTKSDKWRLQSTDNKQGSAGYLKDWHADQEDHGISPGEFLRRQEKRLQEDTNIVYKHRLEFGVAREQARKDIPVSTYSELYWQMDLRNLLHFMSLRCDSHAQLEIREFANVIAGIVKICYPILFDAWIDYSFCAKNFTRLDLELLRWCQNNLSQTDIDFWEINYAAICGTGIEKPHEKIGMGKRELNEFFEKIKGPRIPNFDLDLSKVKSL